MAIREELVASAVQFLQDPSVASSSFESRLSFLQSKNLTQEEIDASLARAGANAAPVPQAPYGDGASRPPQSYFQPYSQYAWQPPSPTPRRDWRDWFIVATVVSGVGYGLYTLGKRYVYPLVAPPTPERLEQDKKSIEEQFDKAFALVEQLGKDTEALKNAEHQRTERLDTALLSLEAVMADLKAANRRHEDDSQRIRQEVQSLKDAIPKAMNNQKDVTDNRLSEINSELTSLKTLVSQRMASGPPPSSATPAGQLRHTAASVATPAASSPTVEASNTILPETPKVPTHSTFSRGTGLPNGPSGGKASIPAWQMAMTNQNTSSSSASTTEAASAVNEQAQAEASRVP